MRDVSCRVLTTLLGVGLRHVLGNCLEQGGSGSIPTPICKARYWRGREGWETALPDPSAPLGFVTLCPCLVPKGVCGTFCGLLPSGGQVLPSGWSSPDEFQVSRFSRDRILLTHGLRHSGMGWDHRCGTGNV